MARAADVELSIDDFQPVADKTPYLADLMYVQSNNSDFFELKHIF
jgi:dihydroxyacid dehydratase/phosphogluconate dehydratase